MNKELFDSMQKQMTPSPEVRAELTKKLARPVKRRTPVRKYAALAACAALVIGAFSVYNLYQDKEKWVLIVRNFERGTIIDTPGPLHSYVTVEGTAVYTENVAVNDKGSGGDVSAIEVLTGSNTGDLPGGAYIGDVPSQEEAVNAYQKLMDRFNGTYPDWYGGAYIDGSGWLVVQLVEDKDPGDKSLELQVLDWTDDGHVMFSSCKYSLAGLNRLMDQLNAFPEAYPECARIMAGWGIDEERNRIELTLTEADESVLSLLGGIDPDGDAIYVQVGQRVVFDDKDLIAVEPYYDGDKYDVEHLPEELPQEKQPATAVEAQAQP